MRRLAFYRYLSCALRTNRWSWPADYDDINLLRLEYSVPPARRGYFRPGLRAVEFFFWTNFLPCLSYTLGPIFNLVSSCRPQNSFARLYFNDSGVPVKLSFSGTRSRKGASPFLIISWETFFSFPRLLFPVREYTVHFNVVNKHAY